MENRIVNYNGYVISTEESIEKGIFFRNPIQKVFFDAYYMDESKISAWKYLHDIKKTIRKLYEILIGNKNIIKIIHGQMIQIGVDLCRKYKESPLIINAVEAHHGDVEPDSLIACLVQAADTISAARPGARRETMETYVKRLEQLETIANGFKGVEKSFAVQAGREVRVIVEAEMFDDLASGKLARDIAKKIENELDYPGQIRVTVVREFRAVEIAK